MNLYYLLAIVALLATIVILGRGIVSMTRGRDSDYEASTRLMFERVEFQAATVVLILAGVLFAFGWFSGTGVPPARVNVNLGVLSSDVMRQRYGPDTPEARAYGGIPEQPDSYLVTVALTDRSDGTRIEDATVNASVGPLGLTSTDRVLKPASFGGAVTYGNYFRMPDTGIYEIAIRVARRGVTGTDNIRLEYDRE